MLKAKYKFDKYKSMLNKEDLVNTRELLQQSIKLDNNLLAANILLGQTYLRDEANYGKINESTIKARHIYEHTLKQAERLGDKETQDKMQQQIAWLQQQQFNKYR